MTPIRLRLLSGCLAVSFAGLCFIGEWARGAPPAPPPRGTIAYVRDWEQIRLIKPDGTGDRELWTQPPSESRYGGVGELAFRPDGEELVFSSSHEKAMSYYESDLYGIGLDGKGLRRLTNAPSVEQLASYPKCKVAVTVTNHSTDPLVSVVVLYVVGASGPKSLMVPPNGVATVTFDDVAALPGALQPVMAAFGGKRWPGPPLRLVAGQTNKASMTLTGTGFEMMGAYRPVWTRDGKRVAYRFGQAAGIWCVPGEGQPGAGIGVQIGGKGKELAQVASFDWGPPDARGGSLLYARGFDADGEPDNSVYQTDEHGHQHVRVLHYEDPGKGIQQVRWLPDGSGFIVVRMEPLTFGEAANLCRFDFATRRETQLTRFENEAVRDFAISPDGHWIVYERGQAVYNPWDKTRPALWLMRTDGRDDHLLVESGEMPAWGP
jgi:TolB protein